MEYFIDIWSSGYVSKRFKLAANIVVPNLLDTKTITYKNIDLETSTFDTYTFNLLPRNGIPVTGHIKIYLSTLFIDFSNCDVYGGIRASC